MSREASPIPMGLFLVTCLLLSGCCELPAGEIDAQAERIAVPIVSTHLAGVPLPTPRPTRTPISTQTPRAAGKTEGGGTATPLPRGEEEVTVTVWSPFAHWPEQQEVLEAVFSDYMAERPHVTIEVKHLDLGERGNVFEAVLAADAGAPDIVFFDGADEDWVDGGWLENIGDIVDPDRFHAGYEGHWASSYGIPLRLGVDLLLYNSRIFDDLGINVPDDHQFTYDEFLEVVETCRGAGHPALANASVDGAYVGGLIPKFLLLGLVGDEEFNRYYSGSQSWDTPEVRHVLEVYVALIDTGLYADEYGSAGVESSGSFHTKRNACMLAHGSWQSVWPFSGSDPQPEDFGFLKYPLLDGGQGAGLVAAAFGDFVGVVSTSENKHLARDLIRFWQQPKYGALYTYKTKGFSAIKFTPDDAPAGLLEDPEIVQWSWYWDEIDAVYGDGVFVHQDAPCSEFREAYWTVMDERLPQGLITVGEAIEHLDGNLCQD